MSIKYLSEIFPTFPTLPPPSPARASPDYGPLSGDLSDSGGVQCSVDSSVVEWERREAMQDPPLYQCKVNAHTIMALYILHDCTDCDTM